MGPMCGPVMASPLWCCCIWWCGLLGVVGVLFIDNGCGCRKWPRSAESSVKPDIMQRFPPSSGRSSLLVIASSTDFLLAGYCFMHPVRRHRLFFILFIVFFSCVAVGLLVFARRDFLTR